jgi:hypothetical protein
MDDTHGLIFAPHACAVDICEFTLADEMAGIGYDAAKRQAFTLSGQLRLLDPKLF